PLRLRFRRRLIRRRLVGLRIASRCFGLGFIGLGGFFVGLAAVIGLIEAGAFEDQPAAGAEQATELVLLALGALLLRLGCDRLEDFEFVLAGVATVIVCRHEAKSEVECRMSKVG